MRSSSCYIIFLWPPLAYIKLSLYSLLYVGVGGGGWVGQKSQNNFNFSGHFGQFGTTFSFSFDHYFLSPSGCGWGWGGCTPEMRTLTISGEVVFIDNLWSNPRCAEQEIHPYPYHHNPYHLSNQRAEVQG